jgi:hypothetical protein
VPTKDPDANLPFTWDWSAWLANEDDAAAAFAWVVPGGIAKGAETADAGKATAWFSGGTDGEDYPVTCHITTTGGRTDDRTMVIKVRRR